MNWYLEVLKKYAVFSGRAHRKEYWLFVLFNLIIGLVLGFIDVAAGLADAESGYGPLGGLYTLAVLIPGIAVSVRRLHDTDHSAWWLLIALVPLIGAIVLLVFMVRDSQQGQNQYGPNPKEAVEELGKSNDATVVDQLIFALENTNNEVRLNAMKALSTFILELKKRQEMVRRGAGSPISDAELTALRKARKAVQGRALEVERHMRDLEIQRIGRHEKRLSPDEMKPDVKGLIFKPRCPLCGASFDPVSRPRGVMTSGTIVCRNCKQQVSLRVSPKNSRLYVRMLTLPIHSVDPGEIACDPLPEATRESRPIKQEEPLTVGKRLAGERHKVSSDTSKVDRAGKCRDCGAVVKLTDAKEVCLDWDGVDAYHFYCPLCYRGTGDPDYYTGQLIGRDGNAVIDQHSWYYER